MLLAHRPRNYASHIYTYQEEFRAGDGGGQLVVFTPRIDGEDWRTVVDAGKGRIHRFDLSFDGKEVVFAMQNGRDKPFQICRVNADGSGLVQLTSGPSNDYDPCWLPDGGIAFISTRDHQWALCLWSRVGLLYRMDRDGGSVRQISYGVVHDLTPSVMEDGRIVYTRWEYVDKGVQPIQSLWTINADGTGLQGYYGSRVIVPGAFFEPRAVPGTGCVLSTLMGHMAPLSGATGLIDPRHGDNAPESVSNLTPEVPVKGLAMPAGVLCGIGPYEGPYPIDQEHFLVTRSGMKASDEGTLELRDFSGRKLVEIVGPTDGRGYYTAQPLWPRRCPPVRRSVLPDTSDGTATLFLQDVYRGLEPEVRRGEVKQLCVVHEVPKAGPQSCFRPESFEGHQFTVISRYGTYAAKEVLGYVPVAEDGSALFKVPARTPIYFLALDGEGRAVQRMRTFTFLMPGEVRGCVGCHEPRSSASPSNSFASAHDKGPVALVPPEWGVKGFTYPKLIQPIWDRHCVACHQGKDEPKGINLTGEGTNFFNVSYETLVGHLDKPEPMKYVNWLSTASFRRHELNIPQIEPKRWGAVRSSLAELVRTGHPDKNGKPRVELDETSRRRIFAWIDLNVPYWGSYEKPDVAKK